jgi:hypothetical protein
MAQNVRRGYQGPAFGASSAQQRRRASVLPDEESIQERSIMNHSHISNRNSILQGSHISEGDDVTRNLSRHAHSVNTQVAPLHDPAGRPLRRHGTETFGDVLLHPFKELQLHNKRANAFETERKEWNEKHPESIISENELENVQEEEIM